MILEEISFYTYCLPLVHPLKMKGYLQYERRGLIVELIDDNGNKGYGDASPFTGLHQESINDIIIESSIISSQLYKMDVENFSLKIEQIISPSLHFALEWALVDLLARSKNLIPSYFLNKNSQSKIMINALLTGDFDEILESAKVIMTQKPVVAKIKVGNRPLEDDIFLIQEINNIFEGKVKLRLDANRSWSLEQAKLFTKGTIDTNIEFIEEPVNDPFDHQAFYENTGIRFALDETLTDCSIEDIKSMTGLAAFIIKPSVFGSINFIKSWIDFANVLNVNVIFSSAFESSIGLWSIAQMASAFSRDGTAHGLDTYRWLKQDLLTPAFKPQKFQIDLEQNKSAYVLNKDLLKPILYESLD